jgi:Adenylate cyclase, family 3 (some proteins contain HAMP domain)
MDIHEVPGGVSAEDVAKAHAEDVKIEDKYGVHYHKYWVNEKAGKIFCLCHAPNAEAAIQVHRKAHGMVADKVIEIQPELAEGFLGGVEVNKAGAALVPGATDERDPGIRTILFTDIVESTALTQSMGDEGVMALLDLHNGVVRNALAGLGGREIKHTGDGIMASFVSAAAAVKCATQIQRDLAKHGENQRDRAIKVRIGAAAGEPVEQHHDLFGCTVQLAARLCSHASPDQILVSNAIAELCLGKGFSFQDVGEVALKGFDRPVRAHAVVWAGDAVPAA